MYRNQPGLVEGMRENPRQAFVEPDGDRFSLSVPPAACGGAAAPGHGAGQAPERVASSLLPLGFKEI